MIRNLVNALALLVSSLLQGQTIQWQKNYGGSQHDILNCIKSTSDGGYIIAGSSSSSDVDVPGNQGVFDFWLLKLNAFGGIEWNKTFGGSGNDNAYSVAPTMDGGYIIAGSTGSEELPGFHDFRDLFIVKLNNSSALEWQKLFGGSGSDEAKDILVDQYNNILVIGSTDSNDGDLSGTNGFSDFWILYLSNAGQLLWQKTYGGSNDDFGNAIIKSADGGYLAVGETRSHNGDVSKNNGESDFWVLKLDSLGSKEWEGSFGGLGIDVAYKAIELNNHYYIIGVESSGTSGDVTGSHGSFDAWTIKLNHNGTLIWQKPLGGSIQDYAYSAVKSSSTTISLVGSTYSTNGDVIGNNGGQDCWIATLDTSGILSWQYPMGGTLAETGTSIELASDGSLLIGAYAQSNDGDIPLNHGKNDYWIIKLAQPTTNAGIPSMPEIKLFPNPAQDQLELSFPEDVEPCSISIFDLSGKHYFDQKGNAPQYLDISCLPESLYLIKAMDVQGRCFSARFFKADGGR